MPASGERVNAGSIAVQDAIAGREGFRGVQRLLLGEEPMEVLRGVLKDMLLAPEALTGCRLTRAKFRSGHKLTAWYDVMLSCSETAAVCTRPVAVTWSPEKRNGGAEEGDDGILDEARRRDVCAPFRHLSGEAPEWNLRVKAAPLDTSFPQLVRLSDPVYAGKVFGCVPQIHCLRYRPGRRHVLRYDFAAPAGSHSVFVKLYSPGRARRTYDDSQQLCEWLAESGTNAGSLHAADVLESDSAVVLPNASGIPLSAYYKSADPSLPRLFESTGRALRLLQGAPATLTRGRRRDFTEHIELIASAAAHRGSLFPRAADALPEFLDRFRRAHERIGREPDVFTHGDMKAEHVYVNDRELTFIDFDCRCLADPAYDSGKFMADLELGLSPFGPAAIERAQSYFLAGYAPSPERLARVRLWQSMMMVYLGWRRLQWFSPDPAAVLEDVLGQAERVLRLVENTYHMDSRCKTFSH